MLEECTIIMIYNYPIKFCGVIKFIKKDIENARMWIFTSSNRISK